MDTLHASAVAFDGQAALLIGPSGSGKSSLALELVALGGTLVADDRVIAEPRGEGVLLRAPDALANRIEARGVGLLSVPTEPAWAAVVIDMGQTETERLPPEGTTMLAGVAFPLLRVVESRIFAAMVRAYLRGGRVA